MSGQKKLDKVTRHNRVVAFPSKRKECIVTGTNGEPLFDKNGSVVTEEVQLYRIKPLH